MSLHPTAVEEHLGESWQSPLAWVREFRSEPAQFFERRSTVQRLPRVTSGIALSTLPLAEDTYKYNDFGLMAMDDARRMPAASKMCLLAACIDREYIWAYGLVRPRAGRAH